MYLSPHYSCICIRDCFSEDVYDYCANNTSQCRFHPFSRFLFPSSRTMSIVIIISKHDSIASESRDQLQRLAAAAIDEAVDLR